MNTFQKNLDRAFIEPAYNRTYVELLKPHLRM